MQSTLDPYLDATITEGLYSTRGNLRFAVEHLFAGVDFRDKRVLDIGGGKGVYSYYAATQGAKEVVCLEPEADGSSPGMNEKFARLGQRLHVGNVELNPSTLQAFERRGEPFDVVLLHNSINHLDEPACVELLDSARARQSYRALFSKIAAMCRPGATLIICDCSRYNVFATLGLRNPMMPTIEWHKHQAPEVWAALLQEAGFVDPRIRWSSFNRLRGFGRVLLGNKLAAYFLASHFCLKMRRA